MIQTDVLAASPDDLSILMEPPVPPLPPPTPGVILDGSGSEIIFYKTELEASLQRNSSLEKENNELLKEVARLKSQLSSLRAHDKERKSLLWKKIHSSIDADNCLLTSHQKPSAPVKPLGEDQERHVQAENSCLKLDPVTGPRKETGAPKLFTALPSHQEMNGRRNVPLAPGPPPPPPPPSKSSLVARTRIVRRVPQVVELYRFLTRKDVYMEPKSNPEVDPLVAVALNKNLIGEIENRSAYLLAIKSEVERQGQFINYLIKEVNSAAFGDICDVETFVKWLDEELASLVDERAVLKHFPQWPERKVDAMREAAFSFRDLRNLDSEVKTFQDNPKEPLVRALKRLEAYQDRLEGSIGNVERMRESTSKRYRDFHIPWQWMQESGLVGQMKLSSLRLARHYMKRIARELRFNSNGCAIEGNLLLPGVRFAYRVHQEVSTKKPLIHLRN